MLEGLVRGVPATRHVGADSGDKADGGVDRGDGASGRFNRVDKANGAGAVDRANRNVCAKGINL